MVSTIAGDRMTVVAPSIVLTKQTESSPFRFTEVAKEWGIDFVQFSGMTKEKYFPTANGSGVAMFDYDNDGLMDLYFASCTLLPLGTAEKGPNRLFKNLGGGKFKDVTEASGLGFRGFCHGSIVGDLDNDGDIDIVVNEKDRPAAVLRNDTPTKNHWIRLVLQGTKSNRDAIGTRVEVHTGKTIKDERDGKQKEWKIFRQRKGGVSLESANDPRLLIGVGDVTEVKKVIIRWPSGIVTTLEKVKVDQTYPIVEPKDGVPEKKPAK